MVLEVRPWLMMLLLMCVWCVCVVVVGPSVGDEGAEDVDGGLSMEEADHEDEDDHEDDHEDGRPRRPNFRRN